MPDNSSTKRPPHDGRFTRRAFTALGLSIAFNEAAFAFPLNTQSRSQNLEGTDLMSQASMKQMTEIGRGGLLVVAQWEAKEGKTDAVIDTLRRFLPQAQSEPGVKLFLISQAK